MEKDIPSEFWTKWLKSDEEKRIELVKNTLIAKELNELMLKRVGNKIDKEHVKYMTARTINDYFQDLENTILFDK
jgi:predicted metalloendopeptidase